MLEYYTGDELGDAGLYWRDGNGALIDFTSGYTFSLRIYDHDGSTVLVTKSTGITGAAGSLTVPTPNVTVAWATTAELTSITTPGDYQLRLTATRVADSKTRTFPATIRILALAS